MEFGFANALGGAMIIKRRMHTNALGGAVFVLLNVTSCQTASMYQSMHECCQLFGLSYYRAYNMQAIARES